MTAAELRKHNDVCSICLGEMSRARKTWSVIHMLFLKPPPPHHTHTFLHFQANKPSILGAAISSIRPVWRRPSTLSMLVQCANRISQHGRWKPEKYIILPKILSSILCMSSSSSTVPFFLQNKVNESNDGTIMSKKIIHYNNLQRMTSITISCKKSDVVWWSRSCKNSDWRVDATFWEK